MCHVSAKLKMTQHDLLQRKYSTQV